MQVILLQDVEALGEQGEVVSVKDGYARNLLLCKNLAVQATPGALKDRERRIAQIRVKAEKKHQEDLEKAEKITALQSITLEAHVGENGKLFGTITTKELAAILKQKAGLEIERKNINVDHPIHRVGEYTVSVRFSSKVTASITIQVVGTTPQE